jgi:hypothetical protein
MTVKELIARLQELPPDMEVVQRGYEDGWNPISTVTTLKVIACDGAWYNGHYQQYSEDMYETPLIGAVPQEVAIFAAHAVED